MIFQEQFRPLVILLAAMAVGLVVKEMKLSRHTSLGENSNLPTASDRSTVGRHAN
jgi:hypothetical protein